MDFRFHWCHKFQIFSGLIYLWFSCFNPCLRVSSSDQEGHRAAYCPENKLAGSEPKKKNGAVKRNKGKLQNKQYQCAYCCDDSKNCQTLKCTDLKQLDYDACMQLLEVNQDCKFCTGDCPLLGSVRLQKRFCSQGVQGRGCGEQHVMHELFCAQAKCFVSCTVSTTRARCGMHYNNPWGRGKNQVVLQVMRVPPLHENDPP